MLGSKTCYMRDLNRVAVKMYNQRHDGVTAVLHLSS